MIDHPCRQDCPRRAAGCKISCPDLQAWEDAQKPIRKARKHRRMIDGYIADNAHATKRRVSGFRPVAWPGGAAK